VGSIDPEKIVTIRYTNYRGETGVRRVLPIEIRFISTEWHPQPQWIMEAYDVEKGAQRSFALKDILEWSVNDSHAKGKVTTTT
jgi:predicted DNA-binding transcriptional regulator YafY